MEKDLEWFKSEFAPKLLGYEISYRFYDTGDFGSLAQIEFNSEKIGGNIDFWGMGWLGVFVWDYEGDRELLNLLLEPKMKKEKEEVFDRLQELIGS